MPHRHNLANGIQLVTSSSLVREFSETGCRLTCTPSATTREFELRANDRGFILTPFPKLDAREML